MKTFKKLILFVAIVSATIFLGSCSKTAENEHLPEYCRSYSTFMETASPDLYELVDGINRYEYLNAISEIELEFEMDDPSREIDLDGIQCFQNLTSLSLSGVSFKDISEISALKNIQEITLVNTSVVSIDSMKNLSKVKSLTITDTKSLQSVKGVGEMTKLTKLELVGNGIVNIDELSKLSNLVSLDLSNNEMEFFPSISGLESLETLNLSGNRIAGFGMDLSGLANVHYLNLSNNRISDLSSFGDLRNLTYLNLSDNNLGAVVGTTDFSSLVAANGLLELHLNGNRLTDISGLGDVNIQNLEELYLHDNEIEDIQFISSYNKLLVLTLNDNRLVDISNLSGMTGLSAIDLSNNNITSFGGLVNLSELTSINLFNNEISVIPNLQSTLPKLVALDLSYNTLTDTSGLAGHLALVSLDLSNNGLETLKGLKEMPFLSNLVLTNEIPVACANDVEPTEFDCIPIIPMNPNEFTRIEESFVTLPSLTDIVTSTGTLNFEMITFGDHLEIIGSFVDIASLATINFTDMNVTVIDEDSFISNHIQQLLLGGNSFTDIRFALGNPNLVQLNINGSNVENISLISGASTDDFDNLQYFYGEDINVAQSFNDAFIDLPELSVIALIRTNITSITNSFNDLNKLSGMSLSSVNVNNIENSFNGLFNNTSSLGTVTNGINFNNGEIASITDSFNDSVYSVISLNNQASLTGSLIISDSFNNLDVETISIEGSLVTSIVTSFSNTVITDELSLSNNQLTTLSSLGTTTVTSLSLEENELSTVSFIHDIESLSYLNISDQIDDLLTPTLETIDGINNVPNLLTIDLTGLQITSINGLINTGLTSFDYQKDEHNDVEIISISDASFENSPITDINLEGHVLTTVDFLDNMPLLEDLTLFTDVGDLSYFVDAVYKDTLVYLYLGTPNNVIDFTPLHGYSLLDTFVFGSTTTTSINNLDNLPSITNINFALNDLVLTISNSFNNMDSLNVSNTYLSTYSNLLSVTQSFDMITSNAFEIQGSLIVADSFNNVVGLEIHSDGELTPQFDALSFDSLETVILDNPEYTTFEFLGNYSLLNSVTLQSPSSIIIDGLTSLSIQDFTINAPGIHLTNIDIVLPETATLSVNQAQVPLVIDATYNNIVVTTTSDVTINTIASELNVDGNMNNLVVNGDSITTMELNYLSVSNELTINAAMLATITDTVKALPTALVVNVNSSRSTQDITVQSPVLNITNLILDDITANGVGEVNIQTNETNIVVQGSGSTLNIIDPFITDITHDVSFSNFNLSAAALAYVDYGQSSITNYSITSTETIMAIDGNSSQAIFLNNNNVNQITFGAANAIVDFSTSLAGILTISGTAYELNFTANNITTMLLEDSVVEQFNLVANSITDLQYVDSNFQATDVTSSVSSLNVSRTHENTPSFIDSIYMIDFNMNSLSSIITTTPATDLLIVSGEASISINAIAETISMNTANLVDVTFEDASNVEKVNLLMTPLIETVTAGTGTIQLLDVISNSNSLTVTGTNIINSTIQADSLITFIANLSDNTLLYRTNKASIMNMDITAGNVELSTNLQSIILGNSSNINSLLVTDLSLVNKNLNTISTGNANINALIVNETGASINVSGLNILNADITTSNALSTTVFIEIDPSATLVYNSSNNGAVSFTTNTENVVINGDQTSNDFTINSASLKDITVVGRNSVLNLSSPSFDLDLLVDSTNLTINASGLNNLVLNDSSVVDFVILEDTNLTSYENTNTSPGEESEVTKLTINDNDVVAFEVIGKVSNIEANTPLLNIFTKTGVTSNSLVIETNETLLSILGNTHYYEISIIGDNLTNIDFPSATGGALILDAVSLSALDVDGVILSSVRVLNSAPTFELTTGVKDAFYEGSKFTILTTNFTYGGAFTLETTTESLTLNNLDGYADIFGENLKNIFGTSNSVTVNDITHNGLLTINISAESLTVSDENTLSDIILLGIGTVNSLYIYPDINSINTNNVALNNIYIGSSDATLTVDTLSLSINIKDATQIDLNTHSNDTIQLSGTVGILNITGDTIRTLSINGTSSFGSLKIENSTYTDLSFIPTELIATLTQIEMDTLNPNRIASISTKLLDSGITLISPITNQNVIDYYHDLELTRLNDEETLTNELHDTYYDVALDAVVGLFNSNSFMDYLLDTEVRDDVTAGIVGVGLTKDVQYYFDKYMIEETEYTEEAVMRTALGDIAVDNMYTAITNSITSPILVNIDSIVFGNVSTSIQTAASENALSLALEKGWTVSE